MCPVGYVFFAAKDRKVDEVYDYRSALLYSDFQKTMDFCFSMINRGVIILGSMSIGTVEHNSSTHEGRHRKNCGTCGDVLSKIKE